MTTYDFIAANKRKTVILIAVFSALVLAIGWTIDQYYGGGGFFVGVAAIYSTISALVSYYAGDKVALAVSGARPVTGAESPYVVRMVENLAISQGMPTPKVYLIEDEAINAFATGRDPKHASIAVTTGAVRKLANEELEGVLAHEMSHVKNYDIRVMTIVIVLVGIISVLANMMFRATFYGGRRRDNRNSASGVFLLIGLVLMIFAPFIAQLIKLAVSRRREYLADASGALMTRFPEGLARALRKIQQESMPMAHASAATAHLFIANPFTGKTLEGLFSTHPPIEMRIAALEKMASVPGT
ncbi:MAG TPA: M48 family metallopeptidase [Candidatus Binatia bacterium]|nr:M48 family metallopeptidase [Candidatus Binatia bacterium]